MERLSPLSAAFLEAEDIDPTASLAIGSLAVFEGPAPDFEDFVSSIRGRLPLIPRYRQRLRTVPFDLDAPVWADDPDFDLQDHVIRLAVPQPAGPAEVAALVSDLMTLRMDRRHPLWELWLLEGLPDGGWALLSKIHHSLVDGISGTDIYRLILDATPEPAAAVEDLWEPEPGPSALALTALAVRSLAMAPLHAGSDAVRAVRSPLDLARTAVRSAQGMLALSGAIRPVAGSSLTGALHGGRRYAWTSVSLEDIRTIRKHLGGTVNDVALAAVSGGFRRLLLSRGEEPDAHAIRSLVPVSTRAPGTESHLGNQVSLLLPFLPVDLPDPVARLEAVHERVQTLKNHHEADAGGSLTSAAEHAPFLPVSVGIRAGLAFHQRQITTVTTNVPGPRVPVYCLGRRAVALLPYVPIADRVRVGIAMFSYVDTLTFGITGDLDTTPDLDVLAEGVTASLDELLLVATR